jgi:CRISPR-associated protein Csm1
MDTVQVSRAAWAGELEPTDGGIPTWPTTGIAIEGDFSGIQRFVLRPVPGAKGAARRLRARSFRVLALTRLVARAVEECFADGSAHLFYCAGGRFLVVANPCERWHDRLASLQCRLDNDLLTTYHGELVFHLAGAEFIDGKIPPTLHQRMHDRNRTPLAGVLQTGEAWASQRFFFSATKHAKCEGCGATARLSDTTENLCETCVDDLELGRGIMQGGATLKSSKNGPIALLGSRWTLSLNGEVRIPLVSHAPVEHGQVATFESLAKRASGRNYLGYLRIDADRIGVQFSNLGGQPRRVWGLSTLLDTAFGVSVVNLIRSTYPNLYPVYGGGDDLFVIGPWNDALDFALAWRSEFSKITGDRLTFSAGIALAKPRQHILSKSEEAEHALNTHAKRLRNSIHALGCTIPWPEFTSVLARAKQLAEFHAKGQVRSAFLYDIIELHTRFRKGDERWHPLLFYQVKRNLAGQAKNFIQQVFLSPANLWIHADFVARYAMLCSKRGERI